MRAPTSTRGILGAALVALMSGLGILTLIVGYSANGLVKSVQFAAIIVL